jgi:hypothetical protein
MMKSYFTVYYWGEQMKWHVASMAGEDKYSE